MNDGTNGHPDTHYNREAEVTNLEQRLATVIEDHDNGLHDSIEETENWLPAVGFEAFYEVSDLGRVRSIARPLRGKYGAIRMYPGQIRKTVLDRDGYPRVVLRVGGEFHTRKVHRLVCETFNGPANPTRPEVDHIDHDRANSRASNLRWVTRSENSKRRIRP